MVSDIIKVAQKTHCFFLLVFAVILIPLFFSCHAFTTDFPVIVLTDWELDLGSGYTRCKPVAWESPLKNGGMGARDYDGFATYRAKVIIPREMANRQLALFVQNIDDADITFFNQTRIGATGRFPEPGINCISAWRVPRVYALPQGLIHYDADNWLEIRVFDNSGIGGLTGQYPPEIGEIEYLNERALFLRMINDVPRIGIIFIAVFFVINFTYRLIKRFNKKALFYLVRRIRQCLNPFYFIRAAARGKPIFLISTYELKFKYLCAIISFLAFTIFIFRELTIKNLVYQQDYYSLRLHLPILYIGFTMILLMIYHDIFSMIIDKFSKKKLILALPACLLTHPLLMLVFALYSLCLPVHIAGNSFRLQGSLITMLMLLGLLVITVIRFFYSDAGEQPEDSLKIKLEDNFTKLFFLLGCIIVVVVYLTTNNILYTHSSVIALTLIIFYVCINVKHEQKRMELYHALEERTGKSAQRRVSSKEKLNHVIEFIEKNYAKTITRDEIANAVGMSADHLSRIFKSGTGRSVVDYINDVRIKNSVDMLNASDKSIIEIAYDAGFRSLRTFNRSFLKVMKTNPRRYRNKLKK